MEHRVGPQFVQVGINLFMSELWPYLKVAHGDLLVEEGVVKASRRS